MNQTPAAQDDQLLDERERERIRWRCRRGLLENDLLLARYFERHGAEMTRRDARALTALMDLSDPDLLEILLHRREPDAAMGTPDVLALLQRM